MATLPENATQAWENREGPVVLTTVDAQGVPNTIYVTCVKKIAEDKIVVADNKMDKTQANLKAGCTVNLLYITKDMQAYQIKGFPEYQTSGTIFENMINGWLDKKYHAKAAVVINIEEVYSGAEKIA